MTACLGDRVAVITGASSGIGRALARELARAGYRVGLLARRRDQLEQLAAQIMADGGLATIAEGDVSDRVRIVRAMDEIANRLGPIELLVANAGMGCPTRIDPLNAVALETMFRVNLFGVMYAIEAVLPDMLRRGRGHLAAISSQGSYKGLPGEAGYCASKAALNTFLEGLRIQLRDRGIAVTTICPGFVRSPMTAANKFPMPWLMDADDAARRIGRALQRRAKVYNFPWQMSLLMTLTRWLPDWAIARAVPSS